MEFGLSSQSGYECVLNCMRCDCSVITFLKLVCHSLDMPCHGFASEKATPSAFRNSLTKITITYFVHPAFDELALAHSATKKSTRGLRACFGFLLAHLPSSRLQTTARLKLNKNAFSRNLQFFVCGFLRNGFPAGLEAFKATAPGLILIANVAMGCPQSS